MNSQLGAVANSNHTSTVLYLLYIFQLFLYGKAALLSLKYKIKQYKFEKKNVFRVEHPFKNSRVNSMVPLAHHDPRGLGLIWAGLFKA